MKISVIILSLLMSLNVMAQKKSDHVEVLYFKANLACCKARACSMLENEVQKVIEKNYKDKKVVFKQILLADESNSELVKKYNAQSQTVVVLAHRKKKTQTEDISDIVKQYNRHKDFEILEKAICEKINKYI